MTDPIKKVMSQIFDIDPELINDDSTPENIARWDSLKHMQLIMALEDEFDIRFSDEIIPNLVSFKAIQESIHADTEN